ncbi:hypothetical protein N665_0673s0010 [Sinapis alba]|nr:hypothetical protein N665_0673s0010 [Sinapis alba]
MMGSDPKLKVEIGPDGLALQEKLLLLPTQRRYKKAAIRNTQYARLEELKRRLEALNPNRSSTSIQQVHEPETKSVLDNSLAAANANQTHPVKTEGREKGGKEHGQRPATAEGESKSRKKPQIQGRGRGIGIMNNKGRGGWTGAGFDVDGRT